MPALIRSLRSTSGTTRSTAYWKGASGRAATSISDIDARARPGAADPRPARRADGPTRRLGTGHERPRGLQPLEQVVHEAVPRDREPLVGDLRQDRAQDIRVELRGEALIRLLD